MMIFDRPTSAELVEAVSEFLEKEIKTTLPNHLAFKTQIAINVLNIVKREQENKELLTKESKEILLTLLSNPEEANINQLAAQIASGKLDLEDKKLQKALIEITKKKISVDNPKYSTYKKLIK
ncbi:MAG TPA: hypothetical protein EYN84_02705 [Gammaproteobacteria bacterium]|nr:hypothetical protein [Gammaproteobacteria bacterium]HIA43052.1 hypothetical protein [Gammaproteobacteria bacterium]HIG49457.1 hypothetical protein [Gammaproteobacteria bacterium]